MGDVDVGLWEAGGGEGGGGGAEEEVVVVVVEQESCTTELGEKYNASVSKSLQCPRFLELGGRLKAEGRQTQQSRGDLGQSRLASPATSALELI